MSGHDAGVDRNRPAPYGTHRFGAAWTASTAGRRAGSGPRRGIVVSRATPSRGMEPLTIDRTHILVLNYNGRGWLEECLPSIREAAARSPVPCPVTVVDNGSNDGSCELVARRWPDVGLVREENLGLASFNRVLARLDEPVVLLLNNDIKLDPDAVGPLLEPFARSDDAFFSAPLCWTFDGRTYEGMRTRVRSRFGLVQGMCRVPGARGRRPARRPDRGGRAGAGRRPSTIPGGRGIRPDLLPGPDRGPRPGVPRLDGRLSRLLRPGVRRLSPRVRHVRGRAGHGPLGSPGAAEYPDLHVEEHRGGPAAGALCSGCPSGSGRRWCAGDSSSRRP